MRECSGIAGWLKHSFIDFPGTVSTVLFYSGCNLRCPFCHNPDLVLGRTADTFDPGAFVAYLTARKGILAGVVITGGEPTLHTELTQCIGLVREQGYKVKVDSNGLLPEVIEAAAPDYLALDLKTLPHLYQERLGSPYADTPARLEKSIALVRSMGKDAEVRITLAPGIVSTDMAGELARLVAGVSTVYLQRLRKKAPLLDPDYTGEPAFTEDQIETFRARIAESVGRCEVR